MVQTTPKSRMNRPTDRNLHECLAFLDGRWVTNQETNLPLDDWGVLQGVMLVERVRTYGGKLFQLPKHIARLQDSITAVGIDWNRWANFDLVETCERVAAAALESVGDGSDIGLVILATPGRVHANEPTRIVHASELPWKRLAHWYRDGQDLITATIRNVPNECWPVHIKTRSRLHYYLADQQAAQAGPQAGAVMFGTRDQVTETSFANLMIVNAQGDIIAPRREDVLPGISLELSLSLAAQLGINVRFEDISNEMFQSAREVILTGTNGGIWGARSLDGVQLPEVTNHSVLYQLQASWEQLVGFDYKKQAIRLAGL
jgi:branched-chain amino acid aminotransferase